MPIIETYKGPNLDIGLNKKKRVVIFDLDGVLFDSTETIRDFFSYSYPTITQDDWNQMLRGNFHEEFAKAKLIHNPRQETEEESIRRSKEYSVNKMKSPLYDGVAELLDRLHKNGDILVINTSALAKNCLPMLENSNIKEFFDFIATAETSKSKVEKFKIVLEKYDVKNEDSIFITDTLGDIREADQANIPTIAVTWGAHTKIDFQNETHKNITKVVDSVRELEKVLL